MIRFLSLFLALTFSCAATTGSSNIGREFMKADFDWIQIGVTTRDQVVAHHGSPSQVTTTNEGQDVMVFLFMRSTSTMAPFAGMTDIRTEQKFVQVFSDPSGVVTRWVFTGNDFDTSPDPPAEEAKPYVERVE